ncbi:MAG: rod shape-determining protein MreC [Aquificae bacterium]|nr:rod shape-determining protein MreC [Aquificota bacterium]
MRVKAENLVFTLFFSLGLLLYALGEENPVTGPVRRVAYLLFSPLLKAERELEEEVEKLVLLARELKAGSRIYSMYKKQLERERVLTERLRQYEEILDSLERDLELEFPRTAPYVISKIVFYDPSGQEKFFVIRDGKNKGIKEGDLVVARGFVLGVVDEVYYSTSKVKTLYNERCSLLVSVEDLNKAFIYRGSYPYGELLYVDLQDPVTKGKTVRYKDLTMRIPPFPVGKIVSVSLSTNPYFKDVKVKPFLSPREAEFVVVFRNS